MASVWPTLIYKYAHIHAYTYVWIAKICFFFFLLYTPESIGMFNVLCWHCILNVNINLYMNQFFCILCSFTCMAAYFQASLKANNQISWSNSRCEWIEFVHFNFITLLYFVRWLFSAYVSRESLVYTWYCWIKLKEE